MNGLLVNSYHSSYEYYGRKDIDYEQQEVKKSPRRTRYQTWPRKKMSSKKRKITQVIHQIKSDRAISELNLNLISLSNTLPEISNEDLKLNYDDMNKVNKVINNQKRNHHLNQYNEKLKSIRNGYVENGDCKSICDDSGLSNGKVEVERNGSTITDESIFNENKLGIIRLLRK